MVPFDWKYIQYYINPVAISIGPVQIRWYGLMYVVAAILVYCLAMYRIKTEHLNYSKATIEDFIILAVLCMLIGGRFGYVLFYNLAYFVHHPIEIISPVSFDGGIRFIGIYGMSYHGGLLGVIFAFMYYCKKNKTALLEFTDFFAPIVPIGYMFGRLGNFINGELFGRITTSSLGMYFPASGDFMLRHPSQLYEAFFEGLVLFIFLWLIRKKSPFSGFLSSLYLIGYGSVRLIIEFVREPDPQIGFVIGCFTLGQVLCVLMIMAGILLYAYSRNKKTRNS